MDEAREGAKQFRRAREQKAQSRFHAPRGSAPFAGTFARLCSLKGLLKASSGSKSSPKEQYRSARSILLFQNGPKPPNFCGFSQRRIGRRDGSKVPAKGSIPKHLPCPLLFALSAACFCSYLVPLTQYHASATAPFVASTKRWRACVTSLLTESTRTVARRPYR